MSKAFYKTAVATNENVQREWFVVDAQGETLGRLCSKIASVLKGKHKPSYTPHIDCGDYIVVLNANKVKLTGNKMDKKAYLSYSNYPGGQKSILAKDLNTKKPTALVEKSVKGMLPKNKLGRAMYRKLFVYENEQHPHTAQQPQKLA